MDGIIWWGADDYQIRLLQNPPPQHSNEYNRYLRLKEVYPDEMPPDIGYEEYLDMLHPRILRLLDELIQADQGEQTDPQPPQLTSLRQPSLASDP